MEKEHKIKAPENGKERLFSYSLNLFTDSIQPLQVSQVHLTQFLFTALLPWVQTQAPKLNLIIPVGDNSCTPQAVSSISSHIAPHYLCQAGMKGFGQQMKTVPTAAHCTGWATQSNSSWKQPWERMSCSSTLPLALFGGRQRRSASTVLTWQVTGPSKECMVKSQESYTITLLGYKAPAWMQVARRSSGQVQEFTVCKFKTQMPIQKRAKRMDTGLWIRGRLTSRSWCVIHPLSVWGTAQATHQTQGSIWELSIREGNAVECWAQV